MNYIRRKELQEIYEIISAVKDRLEIISEDESEYMNNIPEKLKILKRYEKAISSLDAMGDAFDRLEQALELIEEAQK